MLLALGRHCPENAQCCSFPAIESLADAMSFQISSLPGTRESKNCWQLRNGWFGQSRRFRRSLRTWICLYCEEKTSVKLSSFSSCSGITLGCSLIPIWRLCMKTSSTAHAINDWFFFLTSLLFYKIARATKSWDLLHLCIILIVHVGEVVFSAQTGECLLFCWCISIILRN